MEKVNKTLLGVTGISLMLVVAMCILFAYSSGSSRSSGEEKVDQNLTTSAKFLVEGEEDDDEEELPRNTRFFCAQVSMEDQRLHKACLPTVLQGEFATIPLTGERATQDNSYETFEECMDFKGVGKCFGGNVVTANTLRRDYPDWRNRMDWNWYYPCRGCGMRRCMGGCDRRRHHGGEPVRSSGTVHHHHHHSPPPKPPSPKRKRRRKRRRKTKNIGGGIGNLERRNMNLREALRISEQLPTVPDHFPLMRQQEYPLDEGSIAEAGIIDQIIAQEPEVLNNQQEIIAGEGIADAGIIAAGEIIADQGIAAEEPDAGIIADQGIAADEIIADEGIAEEVPIMEGEVIEGFRHSYYTPYWHTGVY